MVLKYVYRMESLRVMPPVPITARITATTDYIEGVLVPKGTLFFIPVCSHLLSFLRCFMSYLNCRSAQSTHGKMYGARMQKSTASCSSTLCQLITIVPQ